LYPELPINQTIISPTIIRPKISITAQFAHKLELLKTYKIVDGALYNIFNSNIRRHMLFVPLFHLNFKESRLLEGLATGVQREAEICDQLQPQNHSKSHW